MTNHIESSEDARRIANAVEITPEMIAAGMDAIADFEVEYMGSSEAICRAYRAMALVARHPHTVAESP